MAAVWCHWCHVMEGTTYRDPAIQKTILDKFIPVRVDQDADPELSYRYEDWGWPATIMLDKDGNEIFKRRGYIPPELFAKLLVAVIEDPSALPSIDRTAGADPNAVGLSVERRASIEAALLQGYDKQHGGFGDSQHFIQADTMEWALERSRTLKRNTDTDIWKDVATRTLAGAQKIIDPTWGGMFQYSDKMDWSGPHFEKLLNIQRDAMRSYVLAYEIDHDPADLKAAQDIGRWLMDFMRAPNGAFYTSQDADVAAGEHGDVFYAKNDAERRGGAQPPIDTNSYARENGWAIASLATLYDVTGDKKLLEAAQRSFDWVLANRRAPNGGFGHSRAADDDTHLGDTLAMAEAAMALYRSTAERRYLADAIRVRDRDRARQQGSRRRLHGARAGARRQGRAGQAREADRRERRRRPPVQPAGAQHRQGRVPRRCRTRHAVSRAACGERPRRAGRAAGRPRARPRARARHHCRRQVPIPRRRRSTPPPAPIRRATCASNGSTSARARCRRPTSNTPRCRRPRPLPAPTAPVRCRFSRRPTSTASSTKSTTASPLRPRGAGATLGATAKFPPEDPWKRCCRAPRRRLCPPI